MSGDLHNVVFKFWSKCIFAFKFAIMGICIPCSADSEPLSVQYLSPPFLVCKSALFAFKFAIMGICIPCSADSEPLSVQYLSPPFLVCKSTTHIKVV